MGMTIDEYIKRMGDIRSNYDRWSGLGLTPNEAKAFDFAIDTMRKYEKIEQILSDWINDDLVGMSDYWMGRIKEVVEDGKRLRTVEVKKDDF